MTDIKKSSNSSSEIVKTLMEFVYTSDINIDTAPIEKVKQELQENGIDADSVAEHILDRTLKRKETP